jgi:undecaprenyl-diphosphatase
VSRQQWLWPLALAAAILFGLDTYLVATRPLLTFDVPVATFVQSFPWGPVTYLFDAIDLTAGYVQVAVGAAAVVLVFLVERRAGYLMAIGSIPNLLDDWIKLLVARPRPGADLVHIVTPAPGYSYPSGHAVFFTWLSFMLALSLAPHVPPSRRWALWVPAAALILLACLARVWAGDHWPSDVAGGFLLALAWSAFVVWLSSRLSLRWVSARVLPTDR